MLQGLRAKRAAQLQALAGAPEFAGEPRLGVLAAEAQAARGEAAQNSAWAAQYATADAGLRRAQASLQSAVGSLRASKAINTVGVVGVSLPCCKERGRGWDGRRGARDRRRTKTWASHFCLFSPFQCQMKTGSQGTSGPASCPRQRGSAAHSCCPSSPLFHPPAPLQNAVPPHPPAPTPRHGNQTHMQSIQRRRQPGPTRRGPVLPGAIQMSQVRRADAQIAAAVQQILAVHAALPTLPYIEPAKLRGASRGVFVNLLVGGLGTQLYSQAQLSSGVAQAERMLGQLKQCLEWTTANAAAFRQREANANAAAAAKTAEREALQIQALTRL